MEVNGYRQLNDDRIFIFGWTIALNWTTLELFTLCLTAVLNHDFNPGKEKSISLNIKLYTHYILLNLLVMS